jgi:hypothetical protein
VTVKLLKLIAVALAVLLVWWLSSYQTWGFHGDGKIRDSGVFTYPRYHVELNQIPFSEAGEHHFSFTGAPPEKMWLQFGIVGKTGRDATELTSLKTEIDVLLQDDQGNVLCTASGVPIQGAKHGGWILTYSSDYAAFYNLACVDLPMSRRRSYALQVGIKSVDDRSPSVFLVPTLLGGGIELP